MSGYVPRGSPANARSQIREIMQRLLEGNRPSPKDIARRNATETVKKIKRIFAERAVNRSASN